MDSVETQPVLNKTLGFIGCGKISSALCRGFASVPSDQRPIRILVSRRSEEKSKKLRDDFPDLIQVVDSNEEIVLESDIVFIGLLPQTAAVVLPVLPFTDKQLVMSMMAAVDFEAMKQFLAFSTLDVVRIVPLPSSARRSGPILLYPPHHQAETILKLIGTPIVCCSESEMKPMVSVTGHISSFYELMRTTENFLIENGVASTSAHDFITSFYTSLASGAEQSHESLSELRDEAATPGGLNEESVNRLLLSEHFDLQLKSLSAILARLNKAKK